MGHAEDAAEAKKKGNAAFAAKNYEEAIEHFTEAITKDPSDHVFFSNRSACYASLERYEKALGDGAECVRLKPDWPKGYARRGLAEFFCARYEDAAETYREGLKLSPEDKGLQEGLQKALDAKSDAEGGAGLSFGRFDAKALAALSAKNPKIKEYMQDKGLMQKLNTLMAVCSDKSGSMVQSNMLMQLLKEDRRILEVFMACQGMDVHDLAQMAEADGPSADAGGNQPSNEPPRRSPAASAPTAPPAPSAPSTEAVQTPEQKQAEEFKTKGNQLYKKRKFEEAVEMYDKAIEVSPNDLTYYNNKCAVWIEMGEEHYPKVLKTCHDLVDRRYEINSSSPGGASFEKVAKVYTRMASVHERQKDFDKAIEMYEKALTEDNSRQTRNALREAERARDKWRIEQYLDPDKAEEHREKGNELFKSQDWAGAKKEYDEAVKRNPKDAKLYSNRAAALTKLLAYPDALRDLDECLKLDPKFVKAYSRKGAAHFFMKEYHKSLEVYEKGLAVEAGNEECLRGREQVLAKIMETQRGDGFDEEQVRHAMADPEIQKILGDPQINMFLKTMQENPAEAQQAIRKDKQLATAVSKLMAAGVIRTK